MFNYKEFENQLNKYDFFIIDDFIKALSEMKVMPGINKYMFTSKFLTFFRQIF